MRSISRVVGVSINTVSKLLADAGRACAAHHNKTVKNIPSKRVQCDEIWSFVYAKDKNAPQEMKDKGQAGNAWTWTALDADSKLMVSWLVGGRDAGYAHEFMQDVASRLANRVQLTADGHKAYLEAVEGAFGGDIDFAQLVKLYGNEGGVSSEVRYSPAQCTGIEKNAITGSPDMEKVSTSYVERQNLTMRMSMRRFTRLTNAFSKKIDNHCHALALYFTFYNFCRIHKTLRVTPAMEAGISDHVWDLEEIVSLIE